MVMLNQDPSMIERLETDLRTKVSTAATAASISLAVYGVFSIDDLETKSLTDLCEGVGIGVGYLSAEPMEGPTKTLGDQARGNVLKQTWFNFMVILAVPSTSDCDNRLDATKLLTTVRMAILGTHIDGNDPARGWDFVREGPNISESSETILYYSQVWRVAIPLVGNKP